MFYNTALILSMQGRIQDFKLGGALKKIAPSGGRRENFRGISCEKSLFYAKKSYFLQLRRVARKFLGYFVWKITILRQKIIFFSNFRGGGGARAGCAPPPLDPPLLCISAINTSNKFRGILIMISLFFTNSINQLKQFFLYRVRKEITVF